MQKKFALDGQEQQVRSNRWRIQTYSPALGKMQDEAEEKCWFKGKEKESGKMNMYSFKKDRNQKTKTRTKRCEIVKS